MSPEMDPFAIDAEQRRRLFFWSAAGALVVRFVYFVAHSQSAFFHVPILDEVFYESVALALLGGGDVAAINPAFRPLLHPAFLALGYGLGEGFLGQGWGHPMALVMQHLLGVITAVLVAALALRLYGRIAAGALAAAFFVLAGPPLFFEGELLITTLFTFLFTLLLFVATASSPTPMHVGAPSDARANTPRPGRGSARLALLVTAGLLLATAAQARANALVLLPAFFLVPWLARFSPSIRPAEPSSTPEPAVAPSASSPSRARSAILPATTSFLVVAMATALGLLGAAALQEPHFDQWRLLPGAGGINLYLGNKIGADGMVPRQDQHAAYGNTYRDSVQLFSVRAYREATGDASSELDTGAVSRFWLDRTREEIRTDPWRWISLLARKAVLLVWHREIPNNKSFEFMAEAEVPLLGALPVRFGPLLAFAGVGLVAAWQAGRRVHLLWLLAFAALHGASVVLFFVNGRFRLPLWPVLAVLAGGGALALFQALRSSKYPWKAGEASLPTVDASRGFLPDRRSRTLAIGIGLLALAISLVGWPGIELPSHSRDYFFRSLALYEKGDIEGARRDAEKAVELEPDDPAAQFQLGTVALDQDDLATAERHMSKATYLAPEEPRVFNNLGVIYERRGRIEAAYTAYQNALRLDPHYTPTLVNMALVELRAGALERAQKRIDLAEDLGDRSVQLLCARAFFEIHRGRVNLGRALLARAFHEDSELAHRLSKENAEPLVLRLGKRDALGNTSSAGAAENGVEGGPENGNESSTEGAGEP